MYADKDYIIRLRREIHEHPEIGFDLKKTVGVVKRELDALSIGTDVCIQFVLDNRGGIDQEEIENSIGEVL